MRMKMIKYRCMMTSDRKRSLLPVVFTILVFLSFFPQAAQGNDNLLVNGGFEYRDLTGWLKEIWNEGGSIQSTSRKIHNGKYALSIHSGGIENDVRLVQEVPVEPDSYYMLSGWIATDNVQEGKIGANICIMSGMNYAGNVTGTKNWNYYELTFRTGKQQSRIKIGVRLGMYYNTVKGTAYFDDIHLKKLDYTPKYSIILKDTGDEVEQTKQIPDTRQGDDKKKTEFKRKDPVLEAIDLPLILLLISIGLVPVIVNVFLTIHRESRKKANGEKA
jgi:hypothetical protein